MRHIENMQVTLKTGRSTRTYTLPASFKRTVEDFIALHADLGNGIPAEVVLPELADNVRRPAAVLRGARYRENMTQKELAAALDIKQHHLSEMENAKRPISKKMAQKLAEALNCNYRVFL
jgi:ribosome-binding protein aMBF1 (putative translation factor)